MTQPNAPKDPSHHEEAEVHSGSNAFGFFHRHQKLIIYTAGVFTLLTFSVTGALLGVTDRLFGGGFKGATMSVPGIGKVEVTKDDLEAAKGISRVRAGGVQVTVFPQMSFGDEGNSQYIDQLAALHAIAVKSGVDASEADVEAAIQAAVNTYPNANSAQDLAFAARTNDVRQYRKWLRQTLRVSTFLRLSTLAVDRSNAEIVEEILDQNERVSFDVAYVDSKAFKDELKKTVTDKVLQDYLAGLDDVKAEKYRKPANRAAVKIALLEDGVFDASEFLGKELAKDVQVGANEIQDRYIRDRQDRYKLPKKEGEKPGEDKKPDDGKKPGEGEKPDDGKKPDEGKSKAGEGETSPQKKPDENKDNGSSDPLAAHQDPTPKPKSEPQAGDGTKGGTPPAGASEQSPGLVGADAGQDGYKKLDEALRERIRSQLLAEKVLAKWQVEIDQKMASHMEAVINESAAAEIAVEDAKEAEAEVKTELEKKSGDAELEKKLAEAEKKVEAAKTALKAMNVKVDARRKAFDFEAVVKELAKGHKGLKIVSVAEMADAQGLREIEGVGKWKDSHLPGQMNQPGEVYNGRVQSTGKGAFLFQVTDIEDRPFRAMEDIKSEVETQYLTEKAEADAKEKKEIFEKALERLSRAKLTEEIAKIEKDGLEEIEKKFGEWKSTIEKDIAGFDKQLATMDESFRAYKDIAARRDAEKAELAKADETHKSIKEEIDAKTKVAVDKKLAEVHKDVMAEAAKEAGFKVEVVGPFSRKLQDRPRFKYNYPNVVQAIFGNADIAGSEAEDTTKLEEDAIHEVVFMATCKSVEKGKIAQLSRRQWLSVREGGPSGGTFSGTRMEEALNQSYTLDAMKTGFGWAAPKSDQQDKPSLTGADADKKPSDKKPSDQKPAK